MKVKKIFQFVVDFACTYFIVFFSFLAGVCVSLPGVFGTEPLEASFIYPVESCLWFYAFSFAIIILMCRVIALFLVLICRGKKPSNNHAEPQTPEGSNKVIP